MSEQSLRDALRDELKRQGVDEFYRIGELADALAKVTAAHPVEPALVVTDEAVDAAVDVLMDYGHNGLQCDPTPNFSTPVRRALEAAVAEMNGGESCVCDVQGSALSASCRIHGALS